MNDPTNFYGVGILLLLLLVATIVRWLKPSPQPDEGAVSLDIVPGPIEEQQPAGDD